MSNTEHQPNSSPRSDVEAGTGGQPSVPQAVGLRISREGKARLGYVRDVWAPSWRDAADARVWLRRQEPPFYFGSAEWKNWHKAYCIVRREVDSLAEKARDLGGLLMLVQEARA